ncbi:MAG TPA: NADPH-dependent oxidoreductase [Gammaproteobacteria bacterium]|nr:NADPH-dependent oxidoreductase [Gammaproteobacteria bacterium]
MKITIISGSHRTEAQSLKVAAHIERTLLEQKLCDETWLFSLSGNPLPLWDESIWEGSKAWQERLDPISKQLSSSDAFVVIAPEWHGQVPAGLKNFFLLWGKGELAHKPALIVGVSSGPGGAYPVAELRMSSYKNNRICYIPEQLIIRDVESVLNEDPADNNPETDRYFRERTAYALRILSGYAAALKQVRSTGITDLGVFKNGM